MFVSAIITDAKLERAKMIMFGEILEDFCYDFDCSGFPLYVVGFTLFTVITKNTTKLCSVNVTHLHAASSIFQENCAPSILPILILT